MTSGGRNYWVVILSLTVALMLVIMPLPHWAQPFRPDWVTLVALYWALAIPRRFGLGLAWLFGLMMDVSQGTLLGQHAFSLSLILYITIRMHQQIRVAPLSHQAVFIFGLLLIKQALVLWIDGIVGRLVESLPIYFSPSVLGMLLWPWIFIILRDIRRNFHIS